MPKKLRDLIANRTAYEARGWCMAEIEWSSTRSHSFQHQKIDRHKDLKESDKDSLKGRVPMSPDDFEEKMRKAQFTHRSDSSQVILLQKRVFHEKAEKCEKALFQLLPQGELGKLARSLKHYKALKTLEVLRLECSEDEASLFGKAQQLKNRVVRARLFQHVFRALPVSLGNISIPSEFWSWTAFSNRIWVALQGSGGVPCWDEDPEDFENSGVQEWGSHCQGKLVGSWGSVAL